MALADGEQEYAELEQRLSSASVINVPKIAMEGDANGAPRPDPGLYANKISGKYEFGQITSLEDDIAVTKRVIDLQKGPVVVVGHSYGAPSLKEPPAATM